MMRELTKEEEMAARAACADKLHELNTWLRHTGVPMAILALELDGYVKICLATYLDEITDPEKREKMALELERVKREKSKEVEQFMANLPKLKEMEKMLVGALTPQKQEGGNDG